MKIQHPLKKSLGQHFLYDPAVIRKIVTSSGVVQGDIVVEIGSGEGALTRELIERGCTVVAFETDKRMVEFLEQELTGKPVTIIHGDIMECTIQDYLEQIIHRQENSCPPYHVVANIPYYITGSIIRKLLEQKHLPQSITLIVQKEVALRMACTDSSKSLLSLACQAYGDVSVGATIKKGSFHPAPKVDSAIVLIRSIQRNLFGQYNITEQEFFSFLHASFAHKRKQLLPILGKVYGINSLSMDRLVSFLKERNTISTVRAEALDLVTLFELASYIKHDLNTRLVLDSKHTTTLV